MEIISSISFLNNENNIKNYKKLLKNLDLQKMMVKTRCFFNDKAI